MDKMTGTLAKDKDNGIERVSDVAESAWEKGRATWKDMSAQGKAAMAGAQKNAKKAWHDGQELLHKHPGKAAGVAFLIGAVIGGVAIAMRKKD